MRSFYIILSILLLQACGEDFIDLAPLSEQSADNFYNTESDMEQAVIAAYDVLQDGSQYGGNGFDHYMEVRSDNSFNDNTTQSGGARANFDNFNLAASNYMLNDTWNSCYLGIQRCNIVLNRISEIEMDADIANNRVGEMKFIRALTYFNLVRIWGDVPLVLNEIEDPFEAFEHTRAVEGNVYAQIIQDLEDAIAVLPDSYATSDVGRATKGAAQTLLGKVYLTRQQYAEAAEILKAVIDGGNYRLLEDFAAVFDVANENNEESIFEVQYKSGTNGEGNGIIDPTQGQDVNNKPSPNIVQLFQENSDDRFEATIQITSGQPYSKKRIDELGADATFGFNTMVLRYADVLLMYAEALNESGYESNGAAFSAINEVRERANAIIYTSTDLPNQQSFRDAIALERRLELAFENHRWFDLVRTGKAVEVMNAANAGGLSENAASALPFSMDEHQILFPLPQTQIDASGGKLTQNSGYN